MFLHETEGYVFLSDGQNVVSVSSSWFASKYNYPVLNAERRVYKSNEIHFTANAAGEELKQEKISWSLIENLNLQQLKQDYINFLNGLEEKPKWKQFRMFFLQNIAYNRMRFNTSLVPGQIAAERVEAFLNKESSEWKVLAGQWDVFIDYAPVLTRPSTDEIADWNAQAISGSMPFRFKNDAKMTLLNQ